MKNFWKHVCASLVAAGCLIAGGTPVWAEEDGNWVYSYSDSDFTATITKYTGSSSTPTVPSKFSRRVNTGEKDEDGNYIYKTYIYTVTTLSGTFNGNKNIVSVSLPSSVNTIGSYTFYNCTSMSSAPLNTEITTIGAYAFSGCTGLKTLRTSSSLKTMGHHAFTGCMGLTEARIDGDGLGLEYQVLIGEGRFTGIQN